MLVQFDENDAQSRTYLDFDTVQDAMDSLSQMYENKQRIKLREENGTTAGEEEELEYEMRGLVSFVDVEIADLSLLVFDEVQKIYVPHGKEWIKSRLYMYLKKYATKVTE